MDPRYFAAEDVAKVQSRVVHREVVNRGPEFKLISVAVTFVAVV